MSVVWKYFDICPYNESKGICRLCSAVLSRGGQKTRNYGTSAFMNHLRFKHAMVLGNRTVKKRKVERDESEGGGGAENGNYEGAEDSLPGNPEGAAFEAITIKQEPLETPMEQSRVPAAEETPKITDWNSRRNSNSGQSRSSNSNNLWPPAGSGGSQERSADDSSLPENLDVGLQVPIENGYGGNWVGVPYPPVVTPPHAGNVSSSEYYRQLFLGSQAHQIQMMNTTIQNCCQMLHSQQREMQLMRKAIIDLQSQLRQFQGHEGPKKSNNLDPKPHHENGFDTDFTLSNLDSFSHLSTTVDSSLFLNQPTPSNRNAPNPPRDNPPDNLRSSKGPTSSSKPGNPVEMSANTSFTTNSGVFGFNNSPSREKQNHSLDTLPRMGSNLLDSASTNQIQQEDEEESLRTDRNLQTKGDNICEEENSFYRMLFTSHGDSAKKNGSYPFEKLSDELKETLYSFVMSNVRRGDYLLFVLKKLKTISEDEYLRLCLLRSLCKLENTQKHQNPLNEATDQTISESNTSHSSEEDYEVNAEINAILSTTNDSQSSLTEMLVPLQPKSASSPIISDSTRPLNESASLVHDATPSCSSVSPLTSGYIEDLDVDKSRPENRKHIPTYENNYEKGPKEVLKVKKHNYSLET